MGSRQVEVDVGHRYQHLGRVHVHGAACASSVEGKQCQFAGTVCSRPSCGKNSKVQDWWVPIVSVAKQHVTTSDGVAEASGAAARAAFSSTD